MFYHKLHVMSTQGNAEPTVVDRNPIRRRGFKRQIEN